MHCKHCNENLTVHADGTITCSCDLWRAGETLPDGWRVCTTEPATIEDLEAIQEQGNPIEG